MDNKILPSGFGIIRHAITFWNIEKKIQGQYDSSLAPRGEKMAKAWGGRLLPFKWDKIISSDLKRARQTANLINSSLKLPIIFDKRLREADWGAWSGKTIKEIKKENKKLLKNMVNMGWNFRPPEGESREDVWKRAHEALINVSYGHPGEKILVITHDGVIKCLIYRLLKRKYLPFEPAVLKKYHLHLLEFAEKKLSILKINAIDLNLEGM